MFKKIIGIAIVIALIIGGYMAYSVLKTPAAASSPITAIPIAAATGTAVPTLAAPTAALSASTATGTTSSALPATVAASTSTPGTAQNSATGAKIFQIASAGSSVSFTINEVLNGSPKTVVGTTNQVAGQISIDPANPASAQVGPIQVDARTLATDNDFRNRAIKNEILDTNTYEFITFTPKSVTGLPDQVTLGSSFTFKIAGDLTIKGVTQPVSFDVTVTPVDGSHLSGTATATVLYKDFGITIPQVRNVANVGDSVILQIAFTAAAQ